MQCFCYKGQVFFQTSHGDYSLIKFVICVKYGTTTKLTFDKIGLVKKMPFYHFYYANYADANQCMDLKQTRKHNEEDIENTDH